MNPFGKASALRIVLAVPACALAASSTLAERVASVELVGEAGPQATALPQWLQRLAEAGVTQSRGRSAAPGDRPEVIDLGDGPRGAMIQLVGVVGRDGSLALPGARLRAGDAQGLARYLRRIEAEGVEGAVAPRDAAGLTEKQYAALVAALTPPLPDAAPDATLADLVDAAAEGSPTPIEIDPAALGPLRAARPSAEDRLGVRRLARGTALASLLRAEGLALTTDADAAGGPRLVVRPALGAADAWPVGQKVEERPGEVAPVLMEFLPVEVDGFSLAEALDAIAPRLLVRGEPLPIVWDRFALRRDAIDPAAVQVSIAPTKTFYKRLLDRLASQARLAAELRVDEAGRPFLWLSR